MGVRMDILKTIRDAIRQASIASLVSEDVVIGRQIPPQGQGRTLVNILPQRDPSEWIDDGQVRRTMLVIVAVMVRTDPSQGGRDFDQLTNVWEQIEPVLEDLVLSNCDGQADKIAETDSGVEWEGGTIDDGDPITAVGDSYEIVYERKLGTQ